MAYVISDETETVGKALMKISAGDTKYVIDAATCTDCGACEAICPVEAISAG